MTEKASGLFWFIGSFDENNGWDFSDAELVVWPVTHGCCRQADGYGLEECFEKDSISSHKDVWPLLVKDRKDLRKYAWNYFPRGRVQIAGKKVKIYLNINILTCAGFQDRIVNAFHLKDRMTRVVVDNSRHYHCYGDNEQMRY